MENNDYDVINKIDDIDAVLAAKNRNFDINHFF